MPEGYNPDLSDPISRMRYALGDTDPSDALLLNETYAAALEAALGIEGVAVAQLARYLVARYAQMPSRITTVSGQSVAWENRLISWRALIAADDAAASASTGLMQQHRPIRGDYCQRDAEYRRRNDW